VLSGVRVFIILGEGGSALEGGQSTRDEAEPNRIPPRIDSTLPRFDNVD
jgi:hypothetical protein